MAKNTSHAGDPDVAAKEAVDKSIHNSLFYDPYRHFLDRYKEEEELEIDNVVIYEADPVWLAERYGDQLADAEKTRSRWVFDSMRHDPAFMVDPVNDYYMKLIPKEVKKQLSESQLITMLGILDPVTWAEKNLLQNHGGFKPRASRKGFPYQAQMIRCRSKRIAARAGRRIGKSVSLIVRLLHKVFTWTPQKKGQPAFDVVIFTPNQAQIDMLFKMFELFIDNNPLLMSMVVDGKFPTRKNPYTMLEFTNGATVRGFVSGSTAVRGQRADVLVLDEGSFLTKEDTDMVAALLAEDKDVEFWVSSTPKGFKDYFYDRCFDPDYVQFYFPTDQYHPEWGYEMEKEFRGQLTEAGYKFEVLADFASDGMGVFQQQYVAAAFDNDHTYDDVAPIPGWHYSIGVDWNDVKNGTQICVIGYSPGERRYRVVDRASVSIDGWTQLTAVKKVKEMNRKWQCSAIYVDRGFGATQVESLHEMGMKAPAGSIDWRLTRTKAIDFSTVYEVYDPWKKTKVKKPAKPYIVNTAVRVFEQLLIDIPGEDKTLRKQIEGYAIDRINPSGLPIYAADEKYGDHALDAMMLALFAFHMEYGELMNPVMAKNFGVADFGSVPHATRKQQQIQQLSPSDISLLRDKERERIEELNSKGLPFDSPRDMVARGQRQRPAFFGQRTFSSERRKRF